MIITHMNTVCAFDLQRWDDHTILLPVIKWLMENVGKREVAWNILPSATNEPCFVFQEETDAMAFKLRWL